MRNRLLILACLLLGWGAAQAQFAIRPQIGVNVSTLNDLGEAISFKDGTGFQFGADLVIGNRFYVQPGFFYEAVKNSAQQNNPDLESTYTVNRVRIPLMIGYKLIDPNRKGLINIRLFTGPNMSFVTSVDEGESQLGIRKDDFKNAVFGWNAGAGLDIAFIFADFGYQFGLSEVFKDLNITGIEGENSKNNVFYLNAGVRIQF